VPSARGIVAAGHPLTAEAGARVLREGGNAVDAAVGAVLASWVCESLLTGPGAGGYLMVAGGGWEPELLDFFVSAPTGGDPARLVPVDIDFGDAVQRFHCGPASVGVWGAPAGLQDALARWGTADRGALAAPAAALARDGVAITRGQAVLHDLLEPILRVTPEATALFLPGGRPPQEGERWRAPQLAEVLDRFGAEGAAPFVIGDLAAAARACLGRDGPTEDDLAAYAPAVRAPLRAHWRGRTMLTNPPPSAGGTLLGIAFDALTGDDPASVLAAMRTAQARRTPDFVASLLGNTTHVSVIDAEGRACAVTCTNGAGSGVVVPGTGLHFNNIMGEEDLSPLGFFRAPPGARMPSMMAPTIVLDAEGGVELALGSAGSNRIRSAILQVVVNVVGHGLDAQAAIEAPRLHLEGDVVYAEPGVTAPEGAVRFRDRNFFFGGVQAVRRSAGGRLDGGGDPRRGGAVVVA
jgi:gamma-glutamyltranspeptidase / glutathione hydrolase